MVLVGCATNAAIGDEIWWPLSERGQEMSPAAAGWLTGMHSFAAVGLVAGRTCNRLRSSSMRHHTQTHVHRWLPLPRDSLADFVDTHAHVALAGGMEVRGFFRERADGMFEGGGTD